MADYAGLGCWDDVCSQPRVKSFAQDPAAQWYFDLNCSSNPTMKQIVDKLSTRLVYCFQSL
ncbi:hypothetical protein CROQUDRAFT_649670 [Cronartium quercuum f. sp. fusiforme G11]|uniref:Uncharacterized protein n=1 Tax=Cronartium quercuum f. sp. fusiforme G11 TaxID=708437 RepID=A0A9P6NZM0_9BASI